LNELHNSQQIENFWVPEPGHTGLQARDP